MKGLLLKQYMELEVADLPQPEIGPGDVLVRVGACGICGSDVHGYDGSTGRRIPPLVMGHEAAGVIAKTGAGRQGLEGGRPRHVRLDGLLRALPLLPARRNQSVRQPAGAGRLLRRLPAERRLRRVRVGAAEYPLQAA